MRGSSVINSLRNYYYLTKPGIIYGNLITAAAGFLLASDGHVNIALLAETLAGIGLVIGSACVVNNYIDRKIDKKMARTKDRALAAGHISATNAFAYAFLLGALGFFALAWFTNLLTVFLGLVGYFDYVVLYGLAKRRSVHGTLVGSISGAVPPVAGYSAVTNQLDGAALILFLILVFWQMPHFYAIGIYRLKDYKAAGLPILPVKKSIKNTKVQIMLYIFAFVLASLALSVFGYAGLSYLVLISTAGLWWLWKSVKSLQTHTDNKWGRQMFLNSLIVNLVMSAAIAIGSILP